MEAWPGWRTHAFKAGVDQEAAGKAWGQGRPSHTKSLVNILSEAYFLCDECYDDLSMEFSGLGKFDHIVPLYSRVLSTASVPYLAS